MPDIDLKTLVAAGEGVFRNGDDLDGQNFAPAALSISAQTGNYTLVLADAGKVVEVDSATPADVTEPPNASVAFPTGTVIEVYQVGAGQVSIVAGAGVTIQSRGSLLDIAGQFGTVSLRKRATNTWTLTGELA